MWYNLFDMYRIISKDIDMDKADTQALLLFFKALADANRLKILGLLAGEPRTVEQLAALLDLRPSTVSHHLSRLARAGLVSARAEGYYSVYRLEEKALERKARALLSREVLRRAAADLDPEAYADKVWRDFLGPDGRLKTIPAQRKKREVVLRRLARLFRAGRRYTEAEVNEILGRYHEDTATLRREMIGYGLLRREASLYWREEAGSGPSSGSLKS